MSRLGSDGGRDRLEGCAEVLEVDLCALLGCELIEEGLICVSNTDSIDGSAVRLDRLCGKDLLCLIAPFTVGKDDDYSVRLSVYKVVAVLGKRSCACTPLVGTLIVGGIDRVYTLINLRRRACSAAGISAKVTEEED